MTEEMTVYLQECLEECKQLIVELCRIPAPSHQEQLRAEFCKSWFEKNGGQGVYVDEALNVVCPVLVDDGPVEVFMAHTDTVFPDLEPMPIREEDGRLFCPGVCDDTANLAVMMLCARYFLRKGVRRNCLFVANSCEEGLGNLKGTRQLMKDWEGRVCGLTTFDGIRFSALVNRAVGSHRYRVTVRTEGGHSFADFGRPNAIAVLLSLIGDLYSVSVPVEGDSRTTYNVGEISGGTSVNTIAQQAQMLYEYRSDSRWCLAQMEAIFQEKVQACRETGADVEVERIGDRPCMGRLDQEAYERFLNRAAACVQAVTGNPASYRSGSTDCNIPLSVGVPAVCMSLCEGDGVHTREEYLLLDSLPVGMRLCMNYLSEIL